MAKLELYGTRSCPYTAEMRESLEFQGREFVEYDVEHDAAALARLRELTPGQRLVPVLVENGEAVELGWQGRGCVVDSPAQR